MITRRSAIKAISASPFFFLATPSYGEDKTGEYSNDKEADAWMRKWMENSVETTNVQVKSAVGIMTLGRFADRMYYLRSTIGWDPDKGDQLKLPKVRAPNGFVTDFASIPRVFWSILPPDGLYTYPAVIHDFLYWSQSTTRSDADDILDYSMRDFKVDVATRNIIFGGVRAGGASAWRNNRKLKDKGERRLLKYFPVDPIITWGEWKKKPGVFF
ncbi:DUF1353 domain-containing protein [Pseudomonas fluorescens]|uniref:DUF1353 domain-containing protein n=1 Tax=Pseudomonas fluorescens TaxID=294 RepID=A0A5E7VM13_PSEFL|nr:DUF1353 domain-containing protein [Pseudomonas fluorescens]VVQ23656.1 hypothetical protein PS928_05580 [Pseudomonas fluorescens]